MTLRSAVAGWLVLATIGCGSSDAVDAGTDAGSSDAKSKEAGVRDAMRRDARTGDAEASTSADAAPPSLVELAVTGAKSALVPTFMPGDHDYYVRCAAGTNHVEVSLKASPGSTGALTMPMASPGKLSQTVAVSVKEGDAIVAVATATDGKTSPEYWVRCLPHDFPALEMTAYPEAGAPQPGYYLVGNAVLTGDEGGYAMLVDGRGVPIWYHGVAAGLAVSDVDSLSNGAISYIPTSLFAYDTFEIEQLSPLATSEVTAAGFTTDEHELRALPNGDYIMFSYTEKSGVDLTGLAIPRPGDAGALTLGKGSTIQDCTILEVTPTGNVVWQWNASDHFNPAAVSTYPQTGFGPDSVLPDGGTAYDVFHCSAIDVDPANGNLLVSARGMSSVFYVDKATKRVLWKMGGSNASLDGATYVTVTDPFFEEHDGRLLGWSASCDGNGGTGQVSVFDDESSTGKPARAAIYDVVIGGSDGGCPTGTADGGVAGQATLAWQYPGTAPSGGAGSVRVLADGSHIVGWGINVPVFTEIDAKGHKVLDFKFTSNDVSYRALKLPVAAFDIGVLRSTAGK